MFHSATMLRPFFAISNLKRSLNEVTKNSMAWTSHHSKKILIIANAFGVVYTKTLMLLNIKKNGEKHQKNTKRSFKNAIYPFSHFWSPTNHAPISSKFVISFLTIFSMHSESPHSKAKTFSWSKKDTFKKEGKGKRWKKEKNN